MVKSYLRYGPTQAFGIISSPGSNGVYNGKLAFVPGLEDVLVWDIKKAQLVSMWHETSHRAEVTCILRSPKADVFAAGYADGSIRLWNSATATVEVTLNGHKRAVTALAFDQEGLRLASGSMDTDVILWDVVAETGMFRLRGHRDQITSIKFLQAPVSLEDPSSSSFTPATSSSLPGYLVTTSKDTFLKLWDLGTQHCLQTAVAHRAEIWSMDINGEEDTIITGSGDGEVKAWRIDREALSRGLREEEETGKIQKIIHHVGNLPSHHQGRVSQIAFHSTQSYLAVHSQERAVEIFRIRTEEEVEKKQARRKKRAKEKRKDKQGKDGVEEDAVNGEANGDAPITLADLYTSHIVVRGSGKIRSFDFVDDDASLKGEVQIFFSLASNALEVWTIPSPARLKAGAAAEATRAFGLDLPGHRTDIRTLALSSDDELLASASNGALKIWNVKTLACIRTMECGYAICSTFLPGDRQVAVGTKSGEILVFDIASSSLVESVKAHDATVWSIDVRPDGKGLVSGSADKDVKFWEFERTTNETEGANRNSMTLSHVRTLKMTDDVLGVCFSPNGKLIAVSLLDSTVKIFYEDSLKFFLSLYGHKLPVLHMAISSDSKLMVTCSADKNVKIWGLDFGDCHKSIFAHDESVMQVGFEPRTHNFWSVGKDKMLKYWDADKFENIQNLEGHHGEIWALAVARSGRFVVTGSHDKSIRIWEKTDEPLFLEEERERELELLYERGIADNMNREEEAIGDENEEGVAGAESTAVNKQTMETLMAGERIMEALDIADAERAAWAEYETATAGMSEEQKRNVPQPAKHAVLAAMGDVEPAAYVLSVVEKIQTSALYDALLVLPFSKVISLLGYLDEWAKREWSIVLVSRILFFLLKLHHHQIVANRTMRTVLIPLRTHLRDALKRQKECIGYNLAALRYIRRQDEASKTAEMYEEGLDEETIRQRITESKKRKRVSIRA